MDAVDDVPVALVVELTSDIQRLPDDSRERLILGVRHPADQRRRDDRLGAVQGRARARPAGPASSDGGGAAPSLPRLLLVTGMSGAGKSTVLDALEDMGWDCVDNLPDRPARRLRPRRARSARRRCRSRSAWTCAAAASIRRHCPACSARSKASRPEILYLDCAGAELIRRYDETRRRHPLAPDRPAEDGIARERGITAPLAPARRHACSTPPT